MSLQSLIVHGSKDLWLKTPEFVGYLEKIIVSGKFPRSENKSCSSCGDISDYERVDVAMATP